MGGSLAAQYHRSPEVIGHVRLWRHYAVAVRVQERGVPVWPYRLRIDRHSDDHRVIFKEVRQTNPKEDDAMIANNMDALERLRNYLEVQGQ